MTLPYSHNASLLCKMQINDQILWDKLNMPVFVLKYSINLKSVQRFLMSLFVITFLLSHTIRMLLHLFHFWTEDSPEPFIVLPISKQKLWNGIFFKKWLHLFERKYYIPEGDLLHSVCSMPQDNFSRASVVVVWYDCLWKWQWLTQERWTRIWLIFSSAINSSRTHSQSLNLTSILFLCTTK